MTPLDLNQLTRITGQRGSNPGGIYADKQGQQYYIKLLESPQLARNERIAAALYQLVGAPILQYVDTVAADQVATCWQTLQKTCVAHFDQAEIEQAQQWLGVHAWTANWDCAGLNGDNQGVARGRVLTLDLGGALLFRAQGDPKGSAFTEHVRELARFRQDVDNPHAHRLFSRMSRAQLVDSIERVVCLTDEAVTNTVRGAGGHEKLVRKLLARKADMARQLAGTLL